jgi:hypothetical protein
MNVTRSLLRIVTMSTACLLWGCVTWRPYEVGQDDGRGNAFPHLLRVTRHDSSRVVLTAPFVRDDTLYGLRRMRGDTLAFPMTQIVHLERERLSLGRTLAVGIGIPAAALGITYLVVCVDNDCSPGF